MAFEALVLVAWAVDAIVVGAAVLLMVTRSATVRRRTVVAFAAAATLPLLGLAFVVESTLWSVAAGAGTIAVVLRRWRAALPLGAGVLGAPALLVLASVLSRHVPYAAAASFGLLGSVVLLSASLAQAWNVARPVRTGGDPLASGDRPPLGPRSSRLQSSASRASLSARPPA